MAFDTVITHLFNATSNFALASSVNDLYKLNSVHGGVIVPRGVSIVGEVLNTATVGFDPDLSVDQYIELSGGLNNAADEDKIFVILPNGKSQLVRRSLFSSRNYILPGSTIVISRDPRPFDALSLTRIVTPILADLATSAAAIAAISNN